MISNLKGWTARLQKMNNYVYASSAQFKLA